MEDAHKTTRILVDCGLYQGSNFAEKQNFEPFAYSPKDIDALFVTHAHVDHTGLIPKLVRDGFKGTIYSTPPTKDFAELLLLDSEHILAKEADREHRELFCTTEHIEQAMNIWEGVEYHKPVKVGGFTVTLYNAGHILGSSIVKIEAEGKTIVFSGDLGNFPAPIIQETEMLHLADYCVMESTYGARTHENVEKREQELERAIEDTAKKGGTLIIPAFAMERTQDLLFHMDRLVQSGRVPPIPVFLDSPLAIKLTNVYKKYESYFDHAERERVKSGDDIFNFKNLRLTLTTEQSKEINSVSVSKVVIAGSGMSNGGRILHHEIRYLPDPKSMILFIGYQGTGTLGRQILDGADEVTIFGEKVPVRCERRAISGYSAHADQPRLLAWLKPMREGLKEVFLVQGEKESGEVLKMKIQDELAIKTTLPEPGKEYVL
jgi:metallo-beta-lactamase family protein